MATMNIANDERRNAMGIGLIWLMVIVLLVLSIAALVKFVFMGNTRRSSTPGSRNDTV